jgi:hypothetical protein
MKIPRDLAPYFEYIFIFARSFCKNCGSNAEFTSSHKEYSDDWWLDEATAMKEAGWAVPMELKLYYPVCRTKLNIEHNPNAYSLKLDDF